MSFIFRISEEKFTNKNYILENLEVMKDFENLKSKKKTGKVNNKEPQPSYKLDSCDFIRNRKEKDYNGSYCRETFKKHKNWKQKLSQEEQAENSNGLLIQKPKETFKAFNSIEQFDVIGCLKILRPHNPKAYVVIEKNKEEDLLVVVPWHSSWLEIEHTKDKLLHHSKEYNHQNKSTNPDNKITIEDISLSISLERFVKLYKLDKNTNKFVPSADEAKKVKIVRLIRQETIEQCKVNE